jgi:hypothetical protein
MVQVTEEEEGKQVVNQAGETIGVVAEIRDGTAYVDPDPGMFETIKDKLGWGDADEDTYPLSEDEIDRITDDEVALGRL